MRILAVSDVVDPVLGDHFDAEYWNNQHVDLIVSCGDLPADYLSDLVSLFNVPLYYVPGNHDGSYRDAPPEGCDSIDGRLFVWNGLRIVGLGGSLWYNGGPEQYAEWQMAIRILRLKPALGWARRLDLVVAHAPPRFSVENPVLPPPAPGVDGPGNLTVHPRRAGPSGDLPDHVHQGFQAFADLIRTYRPQYFLHGHTHLRYGRARRAVAIDHTQVIDVYGHYVLDL